jgi:hypothetical protein
MQESFLLFAFSFVLELLRICWSELIDLLQALKHIYRWVLILLLERKDLIRKLGRSVLLIILSCLVLRKLTVVLLLIVAWRHLLLLLAELHYWLVRYLGLGSEAWVLIKTLIIEVIVIFVCAEIYWSMIHRVKVLRWCETRNKLIIIKNENTTILLRSLLIDFLRNRTNSFFLNDNRRGFFHSLTSRFLFHRAEFLRLEWKQHRVWLEF